MKQILHESFLQHGASDEDVIRGCQEQRMKDVVFDIAANANQHLDTVRLISMAIFDIECQMFIMMKEYHGEGKILSHVIIVLDSAESFLRWCS